VTAPTPRPDGASLARARAIRLLCFAVVCGLLLVALYVIVVRTHRGQTIDDAAVDGRTTRAAVLTATARVLNTISIASLALGSAAIMMVAIARRRPHLAVTAGIVILGANVTTQLLKDVVLKRPDLVGRPDPLGLTNTFPSGHSTVAMSLAVAFILVVPARARFAAALGGLAYATLVGAGTVTAGWHRPSDVIGAYLVVMVWAGAAVALLISTEGTVRTRPRLLVAGLPSLSPFLSGIGVGLLLGAMFGVAGTLVAARESQLDAVDLSAAYVASIATIAGVALVLLMVLLSLLRDLSLDPPGLDPPGLDPPGLDPPGVDAAELRSS
jgi:membrane-associated phospholipid phosphatase